MQLQLRNSLTVQDTHSYIRHAFTVPQGAARIDIDFAYAPKRTGQYGNYLTLSLFDPSQERGTGIRRKTDQHISLDTTEATPGFEAGALPPGEWTAMINVHVVNPGAQVTYELTITVAFDAPVNALPAVWPRGSTAPRGPGWYRGDLHAHTFHSDGSWSVPELVNFSRGQGLDFAALTDHNVVSGLPQMLSMSSDDLLTMGGFELTTFHGHALALGLRRVIDWRVQPGTRSMTDIVREVEAVGGLFVIAHPRSPGDPVCTGCRWEYDDVMPGTARLVEVWNSPWDDHGNNDAALDLWYEWLNRGYRLAATAGTDNHGTPEPEMGFNVVYAEELTEAAILDGLRRGHLYLSSGPKLAFTATSPSGASAMIGDTLTGNSATFDVHWEGCQEGDIARLIVEGEVREQTVAAPSGTATWRVEGKHWCLAEIRDSRANVRALTNPIYIVPAV